jgi:hypothetical protein
MRTCIDGAGNDSTAAVVAYLLAGNEFILKTLYLIGEPDDPHAIWLTDNEAPLLWSCWGTFKPAVIRRGTVSSKVGLDVTTLSVAWNPPVPATFGATIDTASPYQLARMGYYDNWTFRAWTVYMPTPGDANTFGCSELFGGRIASSSTQRGQIQFEVNSFLDVVNETVPLNVIQITSTLAGNVVATPPRGYSVVPQFITVAGSNNTTILGDCTNIGGAPIFPTNSLQLGYLVFNGGEGSTLQGVFSAVLTNYNAIVGAVHHNGFVLFSALPWSPVAGVDTFYVSAAAPVDISEGATDTFPFVPSPASALGWIIAVGLGMATTFIHTITHISAIMGA